MAHLTLSSPKTSGYMVVYNNPTIHETASGYGSYNVSAGEGVTYLDIKIHSVEHKWIYVAAGDYSKDVLFRVIVLDPDQAERIRVPMGWVMEDFDDGKGVIRKGLRLCELYMFSMLQFWMTRADRLWYYDPEEADEAAIATAITTLSTPITHAFMSCAPVWHKYISNALCGTVDMFAKVCKITADLNDPEDMGIEFSYEAQHHKPENHYSPKDFDYLEVYDRKRPSLTPRKPRTTHDGPIGYGIYNEHLRYDVGCYTRNWGKQRDGMVKLKSPLIDKNMRKATVDWVADALGANYVPARRPAQSVVQQIINKKSGGVPRSVVLRIEETVEFPAATRCKAFGHEWLAFVVDGHTGKYRSILNHEDSTSALDVAESGKDIMLLQRGDAFWSFLFWSNFTLHTAVAEQTTVAALIPYRVDDVDCVLSLKSFVPQRGMPEAMSRAIRDTPYCASAMSHALSRFKYLKGSMAEFTNETTINDAPMHHPKIPCLFRTPKGGGPLVHSSNSRSAARSAYDSYNSRGSTAKGSASNQLYTLATYLPDNQVKWPEVDAAVTHAPLLGMEKNRPRALVLDI